MIYTMEINILKNRNETTARTVPVSIETMTKSTPEISKRELNMVAEAFKEQVLDILTYFVEQDYQACVKSPDY